MQYQASFIEFREILSEAEKELLQNLSMQYSFDKFVQDSRNFEELAIDFIYTSAKIEGNTYDRIDTDNLLRLGITAGGKKYSDAVMLLNLRNAFNQVINLDKTIIIDQDFVCDLHKTIMRDLLPKFEQGIIRNEAVYIGASKYKPLSSNLRLREELKHLFLSANKFSNPFEKAIYLHCNLAYLQCFKDGNKRTARLTQTAVLAQEKILPLFFIDDLISEYQRAIVSYYETGNYKFYIEFFIKNYSLVIDNFI